MEAGGFPCLFPVCPFPPGLTGRAEEASAGRAGFLSPVGRLSSIQGVCNMKNYIIRRLLQLIPVLLGISIAIFAVLRLIPGGFASGMLGIDATPELIEQVNARYGLDQPAVVQYLKWIGGVLHGDFGQSFRSGADILPEILTRFKVTAELTILAAIISWCIALPLGILAAVKHNSMVDRVIRVVALLGVSVPGFALSILIILVLSLAFNYYPPLNYVGF